MVGVVGFVICRQLATLSMRGLEVIEEPDMVKTVLNDGNDAASVKVTVTGRGEISKTKLTLYGDNVRIYQLLVVAHIHNV